MLTVGEREPVFLEKRWWKRWFFVTFNFIISHIIPENFIVIPKFVQTLWRFSSSILTILTIFSDFLTFTWYGVMYRISSSRTTTTDCPSQPLTAWILKDYSATALSQRVSHSTNNTFLISLLYYMQCQFFFQYFDLTSLICYLNAS